MPMFARVRSLVWNLLHRGRVERELDEELRAYIELLIAEKMRSGMSAIDARRAALIEVGGVAQVKEAVRRSRAGAFLDGLIADVRYGTRALRRSPGITLICVALLSLGIGVNAAFFAYLDHRINSPRPGVDDTEGLVRIEMATAARGSDFNPRGIRPLTRDELLEFRKRQDVFTVLGGIDATSVLLDLDGVSDRIYATIASGGYLAALRVRMTLGAPFPDLDEETASSEPIAIVSHRLWSTRLGGTTDAIGRRIRVNGVPLTIVGVMAERYPGNDVWLPLSTVPLLFPNSYGSINGGGFDIVGRLGPGITRERATAAASSVAAGIGATQTRRALARAYIRPFSGPGSRENALGGMAPTLATITGFVLLIACANVAILLLGRAVTRRPEIALRVTLGASRLRVVRQLVTEGVVLALLAGVCALVLLHWAGGYVDANFTEVAENLRPTWRTGAVTLAFAAGTGILFAILPALQATRGMLAGALKDGGIGSTDGRRSRLQRAFVVAEVAMSVALVCATGVFVQAVMRFTGRDIGVELSDRVLFNTLELSPASASSARMDALLDQARMRVARIPGVRQVSFTNAHVFTGGGSGSFTFDLPQPDLRGRRTAFVRTGVADPEYFATAGIPLLAGREFSPRDVAGATRVGIVTQTVASQMWPGQPAIGRQFRFFRERSERLADGRFRRVVDSIAEVTVVGVVAATEFEPGSPRSVLYLPRKQLPDSGEMTMVVRIGPRAGGVVPAIHQELRRIDPELILTRVQSSKEYAETEFAEAYDVGVAGAALGLLALTLACIGVYAVIAFSIDQRAREIGIRIALGARAEQVVGLFLRDGLRLIGLGLAIGALLGFSTMKLSMWREFGVEMLTPTAVLSVMAVLVVVALLASWLPARRAASVDPLDAIRSE
jgi:predicted permease